MRLYDPFLGSWVTDRLDKVSYLRGFQAGKQSVTEANDAAYEAGKKECFDFMSKTWNERRKEGADELFKIMNHFLQLDTFDNAKKWLENYDLPDQFERYDIVTGPDKRKIVVTQIVNDSVKGFYLDTGDIVTIKAKMAKNTGERFKFGQCS